MEKTIEITEEIGRPAGPLNRLTAALRGRALVALIVGAVAVLFFATLPLYYDVANGQLGIFFFTVFIYGTVAQGSTWADVGCTHAWDRTVSSESARSPPLCSGSGTSRIPGTGLIRC